MEERPRKGQMDQSSCRMVQVGILRECCAESSPASVDICWRLPTYSDCDFLTPSAPFRYLDDTEKIKYLRPLLNALFGIMESAASGLELLQQAFDTAVNMLVMLSNRTSGGGSLVDVMDDYVSHHFRVSSRRVYEVLLAQCRYVR